MHIVEEASHMSYTLCICHRPMARNKEPVFTSSLPKSSNESKTLTLTRISLVHSAFATCIFKQKLVPKYVNLTLCTSNKSSKAFTQAEAGPALSDTVGIELLDVSMRRFAEAPHHWGDTDEEQVPRIANAALRQQQHRVLVKFSLKIMFPFQKNPLKNFFGSTQTQGVPTLTISKVTFKSMRSQTLSHLWDSAPSSQMLHCYMNITDITDIDTKSIQNQGALFEWIAPICQNLRAPKVTSAHVGEDFSPATSPVTWKIPK